MLGYKEFHHDLIRKYVTVFGSLFNDVEVHRTGSSNTPQLVKVPLTFSPRDKMIAFAEKNFKGDDMAVAMLSPRMGFDFLGPQLDTSRLRNKHNPICLKDGTLSRMPVPYMLNFELYIVGKDAQECNRILEQILPFFTPSLSLRVKPISGNSAFIQDLTVSLRSVEKADSYQGAAEDRRNVMWTLQFTMNAWFYGPVNSDGKLIKQISINFVGEGSTTIQPGLTIGGDPTSDITLTIPYQNINETDDYGIIIQHATE